MPTYRVCHNPLPSTFFYMKVNPTGLRISYICLLFTVQRTYQICNSNRSFDFMNHKYILYISVTCNIACMRKYKKKWMIYHIKFNCIINIYISLYSIVYIYIYTNKYLPTLRSFHLNQDTINHYQKTISKSHV